MGDQEGPGKEREAEQGRRGRHPENQRGFPDRESEEGKWCKSSLKIRREQIWGPLLKQRGGRLHSLTRQWQPQSKGEALIILGRLWA